MVWNSVNSPLLGCSDNQYTGYCGRQGPKTTLFITLMDATNRTLPLCCQSRSMPRTQIYTCYSIHPSTHTFIHTSPLPYGRPHEIFPPIPAMSSHAVHIYPSIHLHCPVTALARVCPRCPDSRIMPNHEHTCVAFQPDSSVSQHPISAYGVLSLGLVCRIMNMSRLWGALLTALYSDSLAPVSTPHILMPTRTCHTHTQSYLRDLENQFDELLNPLWAPPTGMHMNSSHWYRPAIQYIRQV